MTARKPKPPTTPAPTSTSCTVNVVELVGMLTDLARTACTEDWMPMIHGVLLYSAPAPRVDEKAYPGGTVLVGLSTDRFTIGQAHMPAVGYLPEIMVQLDDVKRILAVFKGIGTGDVIITWSDETVTFTWAGLALAFHRYLPGDRDGKGNGRSNFPKVAKLFAGTPSADMSAFNCVFLARFTAIAKRRRVTSNHIRIQTNGENRPAGIAIGDRYLGLIMPIRQHYEMRATAPVFVPPGEQAALDKAAADKAAADGKAKRVAAAEKAAATRKARAAEKTPAAKEVAA